MTLPAGWKSGSPSSRWMMERPCRSKSLARAKTDSAPSPVMTDMREARGRIFCISGALRRRCQRNSQPVHEARKELERGGNCRQFENLKIVIHTLHRRVKLVVNFAGRPVQPIGKTEADFFRLAERAPLEILYRLDLLVACAFLLRRQRM